MEAKRLFALQAICLSLACTNTTESFLKGLRREFVCLCFFGGEGGGGGGHNGVFLLKKQRKKSFNSFSCSCFVLFLFLFLFCRFGFAWFAFALGFLGFVFWPECRLEVDWVGVVGLQFNRLILLAITRDAHGYPGNFNIILHWKNEK